MVGAETRFSGTPQKYYDDENPKTLKKLHVHTKKNSTNTQSKFLFGVSHSNVNWIKFNSRFTAFKHTSNIHHCFRLCEGHLLNIIAVLLKMRLLGESRKTTTKHTMNWQ
ncbi:CLUMA_CG017315, isoform A [Clunio marinus]|uniref:CLUMA_CG017315, isoform A n=1 Tax=Clunio marinus TaxID=568069 RepID=A0A1J1IVB0_9DIPT|nr:CLUMA_CG017315, isoform A [Clunio marinus]